MTDEQTDWVSGLVAAPKPRNPKEVRVCGDYRQVNQAIKRERHPILTLDELFEEMSGSKVFSKVDLRAGYHQIPVAAESRPITTFVAHRGLFRFKRLPFGVNSASEVFQHAIQNALRGLPSTRNIADDIIVWGSSQQEHDERLSTLFHRLHEKGLTVNADKCLFGQSSLWFYGYTLTSNGLQADKKKVEAIKHTLLPKDVSQLRSFLELANYCSQFIPDFSTITSPLRHLTQKGVKWSWTLDGAVRNVAYASRSLTPTEQRYSQTEREALAVVWGCERFHMYLIGTPFELITDHKPSKLSIRQSQSLLLGSRDGLSVCSSMSIKSFTSEVLKTQQIFCLECPYQLASPHLMLQMSM